MGSSRTVGAKTRPRAGNAQRLSHRPIRALVTGAGGFTGRVLCQLLAAEGLQVFAVGSHSPGFGTFVPLTYPVKDEELARVVARVKPDYVFHLAGVAHGVPPATFYQANTVYAASLLEALRQAGRVCAVLLVGTSAECGQIRAQDLPISEDHPPRPYSHYGISKLAQTQLGLALSSPSLHVVVARAFNIIGPGMPAFLSVQSFIDQLVALRNSRGPKVLKVGNLQPSRDYLDVQSVAAAYWQLIRADAAYGRVVNVCSGTPTRMSNIVDMLIDISGYSVRVEVDPARVKPIDIPVHYGDNRLLRELTGMSPKLDLRAALEETFIEVAARRSRT